MTQYLNGRPWAQDPCPDPCCNGAHTKPADGQGTTRRTLDQIDARQARVEYLDREVSRLTPAQETPSDRLPPAPDQTYPPGAVELKNETDRPGIIRRIMAATNRRSK